MSRRTRTLVVAIPVVILLLPIGYGVADTLLGTHGEDAAFLAKPDTDSPTCIEVEGVPADEVNAYMRFQHWRVLRQIREDVVRDGKRGDNGLRHCRDCHTYRGPFCDRCHRPAGVHPDCWGCHYYPESPDDTVTAGGR